MAFEACGILAYYVLCWDLMWLVNSQKRITEIVWAPGFYSELLVKNIHLYRHTCIVIGLLWCLVDHCVGWSHCICWLDHWSFSPADNSRLFPELHTPYDCPQDQHSVGLWQGSSHGGWQGMRIVSIGFFLWCFHWGSLWNFMLVVH